MNKNHLQGRRGGRAGIPQRNPSVQNAEVNVAVVSGNNAFLSWEIPWRKGRSNCHSGRMFPECSKPLKTLPTHHAATQKQLPLQPCGQSSNHEQCMCTVGDHSVPSFHPVHTEASSPIQSRDRATVLLSLLNKNRRKPRPVARTSPNRRSYFGTARTA